MNFGMKGGLYLRRRMRNGFFLSLSVLATAFGLGWLALILGTLLYKGFSGIDLKLFTDMTHRRRAKMADCSIRLSEVF